MIFTNSWFYPKKFVTNAGIPWSLPLNRDIFNDRWFKIGKGNLKICLIWCRRCLDIYLLIPLDAYMTRNPTENNFIIHWKLVTFNKLKVYNVSFRVTLNHMDMPLKCEIYIYIIFWIWPRIPKKLNFLSRKNYFHYYPHVLCLFLL